MKFAFLLAAALIVATPSLVHAQSDVSGPWSIRVDDSSAGLFAVNGGDSAFGVFVDVASGKYMSSNKRAVEVNL